VAVERALCAHRNRQPGTRDFAHEAWEACQLAAQKAPADPVPWVCVLALAQLDDHQLRRDHQLQPPEPLLAPGPWGLLEQAHRRDPCNREAYHRMLQFVTARKAGTPTDAIHFVRWVVSWAPQGSALLVLPLHVNADRYRGQLERGPRKALDLHWITEHARRDVDAALHGWFDHSAPAARSVLDLNFLAHALWATHQFDDAARVFDALGPYATPLPWAYRTADPSRADLAEEEFVRARTRCLAAAGGG
jgi:hypothetical protein